VDLVDQMIRIAAGEPMTLRQEDVSLTGHAVLCRILAEDPRLGFAPSPGLIRALHLPDGPALRHDEGLCQGAEVPLYYDSLLLELAAAGEDRPEAVARLASGLAELRLVGIETTVELQRRILEHPAFVDGSYDPSFLAAALDDLLAGRTGTWSGRTVAGLPVAAWG